MKQTNHLVAQLLVHVTGSDRIIVEHVKFMTDHIAHRVWVIICVSWNDLVWEHLIW